MQRSGPPCSDRGCRVLAGWGSTPGSGQRAEILGCTQGLRHGFGTCKLGTAGAGGETCRLAGAGIVGAS